MFKGLVPQGTWTVLTRAERSSQQGTSCPGDFWIIISQMIESTHAGFLSALECIPLKFKDYSFPYTPLKPDSGITFIEFVGFASLWRGFETWLTFWAHWSCITMHERQMKDKDFKGERGRMAESSVNGIQSHSVAVTMKPRVPGFHQSSTCSRRNGQANSAVPRDKSLMKCTLGSPEMPCSWSDFSLYVETISKRWVLQPSHSLLWGEWA